jgi:hypothetical protein
LDCDHRGGLIEQEHPKMTVKRQCEYLGVPRATHYYHPRPTSFHLAYRNIAQLLPAGSFCLFSSFPANSAENLVSELPCWTTGRRSRTHCIFGKWADGAI